MPQSLPTALRSIALAGSLLLASASTWAAPNVIASNSTTAASAKAFEKFDARFDDNGQIMLEWVERQLVDLSKGGKSATNYIAIHITGSNGELSINDTLRQGDNTFGGSWSTAILKRVAVLQVKLYSSRHNIYSTTFSLSTPWQSMQDEALGAEYDKGGQYLLMSHPVAYRVAGLSIRDMKDHEVAYFSNVSQTIDPATGKSWWLIDAKELSPGMYWVELNLAGEDRKVKQFVLVQ